MHLRSAFGLCLLVAAIAVGSANAYAQAATCNPLTGQSTIAIEGEQINGCQLDPTPSSYLFQLGRSSKTGRWYFTLGADLYTSSVEPTAATFSSGARLVKTLAEIDWNNTATIPLLSSDIFLINSVAQHADLDVDHISVSQVHPWAPNTVVSVYVSGTTQWDAGAPIALSSTVGLVPWLVPGAALYDPQWNVSWWFSSPEVASSIAWLNHATGVLRQVSTNAAGAADPLRASLLIETRQLILYANGTRLYYTPRSNHPFGPIGFQSTLLQYIETGLQIYSLFSLPERDSVLVGCAFGLLLEVDLATFTVITNVRIASTDSNTAAVQAWIGWFVRDPANPDVLWWGGLFSTINTIGRVRVSNLASFTAHDFSPPASGMGGGAKYFPGRYFVFVNEHLYIPPSRYLSYAGATGGVQRFPWAFSPTEKAPFDALTPYIFKVRTHQCSMFTTCASCRTDPAYCGWCPLSQTCTDSASQCTVAGDVWSKMFDCPQSTAANPSIVPSEGNVNTTLLGVTMKPGLTCEWTLPPATTPVSTVNATNPTSASVTCLVPPSSPPLTGTGTAPLSVQLKDGAADWGDPYSLNYVQCAAYTTCSACAASAACGWCLGTNKCSHQLLCSRANTWSRLCPKIDSVSPTSISAAGGETLTIRGSNLFLGPSVQYAIQFADQTPIAVTTIAQSTPSTSPVGGSKRSHDDISAAETGSSATNIHTREAFEDGTMTVTVPALADIGGGGAIPIAILRSPSNEVVASSLATLTAYDCTNQTTCAACFSAGSRCAWCSASARCIDSSSPAPPGSTCSSNSGSCPAISSASPALSFLGDSQSTIQLTGANFNQLSATNLQCIFKSTTSSSVVNTPVTSVASATSAACGDITTPVGIYQLSLGYNNVPATNAVTFEVYDCTPSPCSTCLAPGKESKCNWCNNVAGNEVSCISAGATCGGTGTRLTTQSQCPIINSVDPDDISSGSTTAIDIQGAFLTLSDGTASCAFHSPSNPSTPAIVATTQVTTTLVKCDTHTFSESGDWTVAVRLGSDPYTLPSALSVFNCGGYTSCTSCTSASQCGWSTSDGCIVRSGSTFNSAASCPRMTSVTPNVGLKSGGDTVAVFGGPFADGNSLYACVFGTGDVTNSTLSTAAYVSCPTPSISSPIATTIRILLADGVTPYTVSAPLTFTFVDCPVFTSAQCSDACISFPDANGQVLEGCGFCSGTNLCTTQSRCISLWVPQCFNTLAISPPFALLDGEDTLSLTVSRTPQLPLNQTVMPGDLLCSFGNSVETPATLDIRPSSPNSNEEIATVSCKAPAVTSPTIVPFSVNYRSSALTSPIGYSLADCSQMTTCSDCLAMRPCGWCLDTQTCTTPTRCPLGNYTSATCPDLYSIVPSSGTLKGGTTVRIIGNLFIPSPLLEVRFGKNVLRPSFISNTTLSVKTPSNPKAEKVSVQVWFNGSRYAVSGQTFSFEKPSISRDTVIGLAIGLSLGLLVLAALIILIAIIVYRRKQKGALFFNVREPDYGIVAFGPPAELAYRMPSDNYRTLEQALCSNNFALQVVMAAGSPPTEEDIIAKSMIYVAQAHGLSVGMINALVKGEIQRCREENTIFRSNSVASKTFKFYSRIVGINYLWKCMARVIYELEVLGNRANRDQKKNAESSTSLLRMTMEVDMERFADGGSANARSDLDSEVNVLQLKLTCQKLFSVLVKNGVSEIPSEFRQIFVEIDSEIMAKFNNDMAVYKAIGGFFFLRFVCPSITAPHYYGLLDRPPNETTQRQLVLISKVIQSLANMQMPGRKEKYMESMSDFIEKNMGSVVKFYQDMREASKVNVGPSTAIEVPENAKLNSLGAITEFLHGYRSKVEPEFDNIPNEKDRAGAKQDFEQVMAQYSKPKKSHSEGASSKTPRSARKKSKQAATSS